MLFTIITLNGRAFQFGADEVIEDDEKYTFSAEGEVIASFLIKGIAGYYAVEVDDEKSY